MEAPKRVLCIMDMALAGRASLAVAPAVLAGCGVQAVALPTALFSSHTGGFGHVATRENAAFCDAALEQYAREGVEFDAVYTGYLLGEPEFRLAEKAFAMYPDALKIVDPVLGDGGRPYAKTTPDMVDRMYSLAVEADILLPNLTEAALLLDEDTDAVGLRLEQTVERLQNIAARVVVTSAPLPGGGVGVYYAGPEGQRALPARMVEAQYPGTGDLFAAALVGLALRGHEVDRAAEGAMRFVEAAVHATHEGGGEVRQGVWFEPFLPMLHLFAEK